MNLLNNLDKLMEQKKLTRRQLAKEVGLPPSTISSWYSRGCENVTLKVLIRVASYFNVSIEELVNGQPMTEIIFSSKDFSENELKAILDFSEFLKDKRSEDKWSHLKKLLYT